MDINVISWYHNDVLAIAFLHAYYCISIDSSNTFAFFPLLFVGLVGEKEQRRNSIIEYIYLPRIKTARNYVDIFPSCKE